MTRRSGSIILRFGLALAAGYLAVGCSVGTPPLDVPAPPAPPWESALARAAPSTGRIYDLRAGRQLSPAALIDRLAEADMVLLGEQHDNPDHHRLQAWIVERLLARGRAYAVAFEMIDGDQADRLSAYLAASPKDADGLGAALDWDNSGWPAWSHYRPIAQAAMARGMPVLAANLSTRLARAMAKGGEFFADPALMDRLLPDKPSPELAVILEAHKAEIQAAHCDMLPHRALGPFATVQYVRDAHMALVMADHRSSGAGVILIAGAGHVRADRGVPHHLARFAPGARVIALAFVESDESGAAGAASSPPAGYPYDIGWFTARVEREDICEKINEKYGIKK